MCPMNPIDVLMSPGTQGEEPRLATTALEALGELSRGASELMVPYMDHLVPFIIRSMQDYTSVLRKEVKREFLDIEGCTLLSSSVTYGVLKTKSVDALFSGMSM